MTILITSSGVGLFRDTLVATMLTLNIEILNAHTTLDVKLKSQEASLRLDSMWPEMAFKESTQNTYGPSKKGRGGKIKKW